MLFCSSNALQIGPGNVANCCDNRRWTLVYRRARGRQSLGETYSSKVIRERLDCRLLNVRANNSKYINSNHVCLSPHRAATKNPGGFDCDRRLAVLDSHSL